eukprot:1190635-Rhodomonas_salina.1
MSATSARAMRPDHPSPWFSSIAAGPTGGPSVSPDECGSREHGVWAAVLHNGGRGGKGTGRCNARRDA